ncbi:MFS transporter [Ignatzschineria sp. LJL83]
MNIQTFLNEHRFSKLQLSVFLFTFLIAFFDGYDTAVIGYIAPSLLVEWGIEKSHLAPVLSAALLGLAIGAITFGPIADRFGRKKVLILSVMIFSIGTTISAGVSSLGELELLRFITGLGLGAAMPNAVTLMSEYSPLQKRSMIVNTMFCGFPLGAALGGFIAAYLIPHFGWRSTLIFGGTIPLFLSLLMIVYLPESVRFLVRKSDQSSLQKMRVILQKIDLSAKNISQFTLDEGAIVTEKKGLSLVLSRNYWQGSLLLWIAYFMGLVIFYGVMNWMPTLFQEVSMSGGLASMITGLFALGGLGAIGNGWLMDRFNGVLLIAFFAVLTAISVALIGVLISAPLALLIAIILFAGIVMNTAQSSLPALAANFYPTEGRTTGVSMMLGIGRFGGIAGSFLVAGLIQWNLGIEEIFFILAMPALIAALCLLLKYWLYKDRD